MDIVNTFISDDEKIPEYTLLCLNKLRTLNRLPIYFIADRIDPYESFFVKNNITWIKQSDIKSDLLTQFNQLSWLPKWGTPNTKYPSPGKFFHRAMERIYYLEAFVYQNDLKNVFHCENDVITYHPVNSIRSFFNEEMCLATPASDKTVTLACFLIPERLSISLLCRHLNVLLSAGEKELLDYLKVDMINEMSLLYEAYTKNCLLLLPTRPESYIAFDPSSYGQYLAGTNNEHGPGFTDSNHLLGPDIKSGKYKVEFKDKLPYVNNVPLFNLHIHSKNLKDFL